LDTAAGSVAGKQLRDRGSCHPVAAGSPQCRQDGIRDIVTQSVASKMAPAGRARKRQGYDPREPPLPHVCAPESPTKVYDLVAGEWEVPMDDFALASWGVIVELMKRLEVEGILDRSDVMEILDAAAAPLEGLATSSTMPKAATIIRRFAASF
jgi:hypothetical protein